VHTKRESSERALSGPFQKVEKRLWIYEDSRTMNEAKKDKPQYVPKWEEDVNKNKRKYLLKNRWQLLESQSA